MKLRTFSTCLATCMLLMAEEREPLASDDIVNRFSDGIKDAQLSNGGLDTPKREAIRRRTLDGLSDAERIRGLAEWMFRHPRLGHSAIPSTGIEILLSPKREIQDIAELRRLMDLETDSNRFFMLSELSLYFEAPSFGYGESFMAERSRGLLMHGPAATQGQSTCPHRLSDISYYTYDTILSDLKQLNSSFVTEVLPTLAGKPEQEKVMVLAKWLKANWPGCENLAVSGATNARSLPLESRPNNRLTGGDSISAHKSGDMSDVAKKGFLPRWSLVVTLIVATTGVLWMWFKKRK